MSEDDDQISQQVQYVIKRACDAHKTTESKLSLVQILKQFEDIVQEDNKHILERSIDRSPPLVKPQLDPALRNKVYLQLMKHKKTQCNQELESINANIELFKASQSTQGGKLQSSSNTDKSNPLKELNPNEFYPHLQSRWRTAKETVLASSGVVDMSPPMIASAVAPSSETSTSKSPGVTLLPPTQQYVTFSHEIASSPEVRRSSNLDQITEEDAQPDSKEPSNPEAASESDNARREQRKKQIEEAKRLLGGDESAALTSTKSPLHQPEIDQYLKESIDLDSRRNSRKSRSGTRPLSHNSGSPVSIALRYSRLRVPYLETAAGKSNRSSSKGRQQVLSISSGSPKMRSKNSYVRKYAAVRDIRTVAAGRSLGLKATRKEGSVTHLQTNVSAELLPKKKVQSKSVVKVTAAAHPGAIAAHQRNLQRASMQRLAASQKQPPSRLRFNSGSDLKITMRPSQRSHGSGSRDSFGSRSKKAVSLENSRSRPISKRNLVKPQPPQGLRTNFKKLFDKKTSSPDNQESKSALSSSVKNLRKSFESKQDADTSPEQVTQPQNSHVSVQDQTAAVELQSDRKIETVEINNDGVQQYTSEQVPHLHYFNQLQANLLKQQEALREAQKLKFFAEVEQAEKAELQKQQETDRLNSTEDEKTAKKERIVNKDLISIQSQPNEKQTTVDLDTVQKKSIEDDMSEPTEMLELERIILEGSAREMNDSVVERGLFQEDPSPNQEQARSQQKPKAKSKRASSRKKSHASSIIKKARQAPESRISELAYDEETDELMRNRKPYLPRVPSKDRSEFELEPVSPDLRIRAGQNRSRTNNVSSDRKAKVLRAEATVFHVQDANARRQVSEFLGNNRVDQDSSSCSPKKVVSRKVQPPPAKLKGTQMEKLQEFLKDNHTDNEATIDMPNQTYSLLLTNALHYEFKVMRKAFRALQTGAQRSVTDRLSNQVSKQLYQKNLLFKVLRAMRKYHIEHYGHKAAKNKADTLQAYFIVRRYLRLWKEQYQVESRNQMLIEVMQTQMKQRLKLNVFMEWQQISVARQLFKAQKETALECHESRIKSKVMLSLQFFARYSKKQNLLNQKADAHIRRKRLIGLLTLLQEHSEQRKHKQDKLDFATSFYNFKCQQYTFNLFTEICKERLVERNKRKKAKAFHADKLSRYVWNQWIVYKQNEAAEKIRMKVADEFRYKKLTINLFESLLMSNEIFRKLYSDDRMLAQRTLNLQRVAFNAIKLSWQTRLSIIKSLPKTISYYHLANLWFRDHFEVDEKSMLGKNFMRKQTEYYLIKAFYSLQSNYESIKEFRQRLYKRNLRRIFRALNYYSLKHGAQKYQQGQLRVQHEHRVLSKCISALRKWATGRRQRARLFEHINTRRLQRIRHTGFSEWAKLWLKEDRRRHEKELSQQMFRNRYLQTYLSAWIAKYNKVQRKKFLNEKMVQFRKDTRNKIFKKWLRKVSEHYEDEIQMNETDYRRRVRVLFGTFDALKFNAMRRKRERLITSIIWEKHHQLVALSVLDTWKARFVERQEKKELYARVTRDRQLRIMSNVLWLLKANADEGREHALVSLIQKRGGVLSDDQESPSKDMIAVAAGLFGETNDEAALGARLGRAVPEGSSMESFQVRI